MCKHWKLYLSELENTLFPVQEPLKLGNEKFGRYSEFQREVQIAETILRSPASKILRRELNKMAGRI